MVSGVLDLYLLDLIWGFFILLAGLGPGVGVPGMGPYGMFREQKTASCPEPALPKPAAVHGPCLREPSSRMCVFVVCAPPDVGWGSYCTHDFCLLQGVARTMFYLW